MERAGVVARGFLRRLGVALVEIDLPAARTEALAHRRAGEASTDDRGASLRRGCGRAFQIARDEHFLLLAVALALLDREPGRLERGAHAGRDAPRGGGRAGRGEARERAHDLRRPHVGVLRRREAVEVEGVRAQAKVAHQRDIAEEKGEHDLAAVELDAVRARYQGRPARVQLGRVDVVARVQRLQVGERERVLLDGHVVEARAARGIAPPGLQGHEEVEARPESRLENDEALAPRPAFRQAVAGEEDVALLRDSAVRVVVHVAELLRVGCALAKIQRRGNERLKHGV